MTLAAAAAAAKQRWLDACITRDREIVELDRDGASLDQLAKWAHLTKSGIRYILAMESSRRAKQ